MSRGHQCQKTRQVMAGFFFIVTEGLVTLIVYEKCAIKMGQVWPAIT